MRPWWSPVSNVLFSTSAPQTLAVRPLPLTLLLTSSPGPGLLSTPPPAPNGSKPPTCESQCPDCLPSSSQISLRGLSPPHSFFSLPYSSPTPTTAVYCPCTLQVSAEAPQSWWLEDVSLSCPASSKSRGRWKKNQGRETPVFSLFFFSHCPLLLFPIGSLSTH